MIHYQLHTKKHKVAVSLDTAAIALGLSTLDVVEFILRFGFAGSHDRADGIVCTEYGFDVPDNAKEFMR